MNRILKYRETIYGMCAIWIMFFHISSRVGISRWLFNLRQIIYQGNIGVDIFMFISGWCLYLSYSKNQDLKRYVKNRFFRVVFPYICISLFYWLWKNLEETPSVAGRFNMVMFVKDICSWTFWRNGTQTLWYVYAICVCYIIFPIIFNLISRKKKFMIGIIMGGIYLFNVGMIFNELFSKKMGIFWIISEAYSNSSILWTRIPVFVMGCIVGKMQVSHIRYKVSFKKKALDELASTGIVILFFTVFPLRLIFQKYGVPNEILWLIYGPISICLAVVMARVFEWMNKNFGGGILRMVQKIGTGTLELYMVHVILCHLFDFYEIWSIVGWYAYAIIPITSILIALMCVKCMNFARNNILNFR